MQQTCMHKTERSSFKQTNKACDIGLPVCQDVTLCSNVSLWFAVILQYSNKSCRKEDTKGYDVE